MSSSASWAAVLVVIMFTVLGYGIVKAKRARDAHRARSDERASAMMLAMHQHTAEPRPPPVAAAQSSASAPLVTAPVKSALQRRARLLDDRQRLLYLVLRSALGDHAVMTNIRLVDLVDVETGPSYGEREMKLKLLLQERLDCVVCSNELVPLAAIMIYDPSVGVPEERIKVEALRELGIRFLRFRADSLPKPAEMRGLVLG